MIKKPLFLKHISIKLEYKIFMEAAIGGVKMKQIFRERRNELGANRMNSRPTAAIRRLSYNALNGW